MVPNAGEITRVGNPVSPIASVTRGILGLSRLAANQNAFGRIDPGMLLGMIAKDNAEYDSPGDTDQREGLQGQSPPVRGQHGRSQTGCNDRTDGHPGVEEGTGGTTTVLGEPVNTGSGQARDEAPLSHAEDQPQSYRRFEQAEGGKSKSD